MERSGRCLVNDMKQCSGVALLKEDKAYYRKFIALLTNTGIMWIEAFVHVEGTHWVYCVR